MEKFDPARLGVGLANDQSGKVLDDEKARQMALEENQHHGFLKIYEEYRRDPEKFRIANRALDRGQLRYLERLKEKDVPVEYVRRFAELRGELAGDLYDFRKAIREKNEYDLWELKGSLEIAVDLEVILDSFAGSDQTGEYGRTPNRLNQWLKLSADWMKLEAVNEEIERRLRQNDRIL